MKKTLLRFILIIFICLQIPAVSSAAGQEDLRTATGESARKALETKPSPCPNRISCSPIEPVTGFIHFGSDKRWYFVRDGLPVRDYRLIELTAEDEAAGLREAYCQVYARNVVWTLTDDSMAKEEKLWICFCHLMNEYASTNNPRIPHYTGPDWTAVYAYDMFGPSKGGNCFSYAAAFAYLAKACGFEEVYACNSGFHGWTEVNGLVYDPEQYHDTELRIYACSYAYPDIAHYWPAISDYEAFPWKRSEIPSF